VIPQLLIQSLQGIKGFDEHNFIDIHQLSNQITSIRLNPNKNKVDENSVELDDIVPWCNWGRYLKERPSFTFDPLFHSGAYYVQEASSMFLWQVLQQIIGENTQKKILDLCAAPGGKSTLLASYFKDGLLVSNEVIKQRASVLVENITKWGSDNIIVTNNDPKDFKKLSNFFDVIVIDAPCSGSGLFRKDKNAIDEWSEQNVNLCSQRQQRIIADTIDCLNDEGLLIYSTCSYSKQENEDVLDWIKETFNLQSIQIKLADEWGVVETQSDLQNTFGYRFYPNKVKGEGFFIAAFKKNNQSETSTKFKETILQKPLKNELEIVNNFLNLNNDSYLFKQNEFVRLFPKEYQQELQIIASYLYIKKAGIELGVVKGKDLIPSHELTMSSIDMSHLPYFDLNKEQALQYLGKKEVNIDTNSKGWVLVKFEGIALGWIKVLQNRINNYYPIEWRILKDNFNK
jgi:NOL1/NOP2/sun family putative RNA methylase